MTFILAKSPEFADATRLLAAQLNTIQNQAVQALDGYNGGDYSNLQHNLVVGAATIPPGTGTTILAGPLNVAGYVNLESGGQVENGLTIAGGLLADSIIATGATTIDGYFYNKGTTPGFAHAIHVEDTSTSIFNGGIEVNGFALSVGGAQVENGLITDTLNCSGLADLSGGCVVSGGLTSDTISGRVLGFSTYFGTDSNQSINASTYDCVIILDPVTTAQRTYTVSGGSNGMEIQFINGSTSHALTIAGVFDPVNATTVNVNGHSGTARFRKVAGTWYLIAQGGGS